MGRHQEIRGLPEPQHTFIREAWLSGMTQREARARLVQHYGKAAAIEFVALLWALRDEQMQQAAVVIRGRRVR